MKNIGAMQSKFGSESFKGWVIRAGCGALLTVSLALGTGHLVVDQTHTTRPVSVVQQVPLISGEGAVPPAIDEWQQFHVLQPAMLESAALVPSIDEIAQYRREEAAAKAAAESAPPPIDEYQRLHHAVSPDEIGAAAPQPLTPSLSKY